MKKNYKCLISLVIAVLFCSSCSRYSDPGGSHVTDDPKLSSFQDTEVSISPDSALLSDNNEREYLPPHILGDVHIMTVQWGVTENYYSIPGLHPYVTDFLEVECEIIKTYDDTFVDTPSPSGRINLIVPEFFSERIAYNAQALVLFARHFTDLTCTGTDNTRTLKDVWVLVPDEYHPLDKPYTESFLLDVFDVESNVIKIDRKQLFAISSDGLIIYPDEGKKYAVDHVSGKEIGCRLRAVNLLHEEIPIEIHISKKLKLTDIPVFRDGMTLNEFDSLMSIAMTPPEDTQNQNY